MCATKGADLRIHENIFALIIFYPIATSLVALFGNDSNISISQVNPVAIFPSICLFVTLESELYPLVNFRSASDDFRGIDSVKNFSIDQSWVWVFRIETP